MNGFDPFDYQNLFYKYKLNITETEINQVLLLLKKDNLMEMKTTYSKLNVLNFPLLKQLKKQITDILDKHKLLLTNNWAQLYNKKDNHGIHNHVGSTYSGIFYIQGLSPTIFYDREYITYIKKFVKNELLLFPSYIPHEVKPLEFNEQRLVISFNTTKNKM
jgi:hypothetical protein|tara:strand:- start:179 stop:661 length:483 start_codon:yes stop_codon:yes gene_type:complete